MFLRRVIRQIVNQKDSINSCIICSNVTSHSCVKKETRQQNNENSSNILHNIIQISFFTFHNIFATSNYCFLAVWNLKLKLAIGRVPLYIDHTHFPTGHNSSKFYPFCRLKLVGCSLNDENKKQKNPKLEGQCNIHHTAQLKF